MEAGILPVKDLGTAKQRLLPEFSEPERAAIAAALVEDALDMCASVEFLSWWVVTSDADVRAWSEERGLTVVQDPGDGLNAALSVAISAAESAGAESVTIVPSDVPLAWRGDIQDVVDTGATADAVVVPSGSDGGTNALFLNPPRLIDPQFGPGSLAAHMKLAERGAYRCAVVDLPRLALDLDTAEDVDALLARPAGPHETRTLKLLRELRPAPG